MNENEEESLFKIVKPNTKPNSNVPNTKLKILFEKCTNKTNVIDLFIRNQ